MAITVSDIFIKDYESDVFVAFQRMGAKMLTACRIKDRLNGESVFFPKVGKGTAGTKSRHGNVPVMNQVHSRVECPVEDFYAGDWHDKLDDLKHNIDERMVIAQGGAAALGRKIDDQIINAARASLPSGQKVAENSSGLTRVKALAAFELLNNGDVPDDGNRFAFVGAHQWNELLNIKEFTSSDWVGAQYPYLQGTQAKRWLNIVWVLHTGLPLSSGTRYCLLWHKSVMGYARGLDITADITWHGDKASWFVDHMMSGGAKRIEDTGVVEIACDDDAAIT